MLPTNLVSNEIKSSTGIEIEFNRWSSNERTVEYAKVGEAPNAEHHIKVSHQEVGTGIDARRRSAAIVTLQVTGVSGKLREHKFSLVGDIPIGDIANYNDSKTALASLLSGAATTGAGTTVLFDCTGTLADAIINGNV